MCNHLIAFVIGFVLDLILGDPYSLPHPIRLIGRFIGALDKAFLGDKEKPKELSAGKKRMLGRRMVFMVTFSTLIVMLALLAASYRIHPVLGIAVEAVLTYYCLAMKCLRVESMKVYDKLTKGTLEEARAAVSMIVGRDTAVLDEKGVTKAAVETVAENTSDGVIAPMLYLAIGGPVLGLWYKSINTMDSMVGYKNDRYMDFGRFAAKLDDVVNFIPARISALLMIFACIFMGKNYSAKNAFRIFKRDRFNHSSPNSAQTESACAGALGLKLAGDASYFGKMVKKPYIGDEIRAIEPDDIKRVNKLMYVTSFICLFILVLLQLLIIGM